MLCKLDSIEQMSVKKLSEERKGNEKSRYGGLEQKFDDLNSDIWTIIIDKCEGER